MNTLKVGVLMVGMTALFVLVGKLAGGSGGMVIALVLAVAMNLGSFWFADKIVLKMTKAQPVDRAQAPELYATVEKLAQRAGLPTPQVYIVNDPSPNAFATGRSPNHAVVAVNTGLLNLLNQTEVEGVISHELAHVKHRDTLTMAIVASMAGAIMMISNMVRWGAIFGGYGGRNRDDGGALGFLVAVIVAPIAAMLIQMGVSRSREFEADRLGAEIAGSPNGLASALQKLESRVQQVPSRIMTPTTAHLAIVNPFGGLSGLTNLFSSHPPTEERIRRLMEMR